MAICSELRIKCNAAVEIFPTYTQGVAGEVAGETRGGRGCREIGEWNDEAKTIKC